PRDLACDVRLAVVQVVLPAIRRVACAAVVLSHSGRDRAEREVGLGLFLMAHAAKAHGDTSRKCSHAPERSRTRVLSHSRPRVKTHPYDMKFQGLNVKRAMVIYAHP